MLVRLTWQHRLKKRRELNQLEYQLKLIEQQQEYRKAFDQIEQRAQQVQTLHNQQKKEEEKKYKRSGKVNYVLQ